jgi:hypothetical protein
MFNLDNIVNAIEAETKAEKDFVKYCSRFGLDPNMLHTLIENVKTNEVYEIVGLNKSGRYAYILGLPLDKKTMDNKFNSDFCISIDIRKVSNTNYYKFLME